MGRETPGINPEEFKSIDPKELVEQEGLNKGAIKDIELGYVGAHVEKELRERDNGSNASELDRAGESAMVTEVRKRAEDLVPNANEEMKTTLADKAEEKFIDNLNDKYEERISAVETKENTKAKELIKKLDEDKKETGETVKKVEWGETAPYSMTWDEAKKWCEEQGGRLPTEEELLQAFHDGVEGFLQPYYYWSATENNSSIAWNVDMYNGSANFYDKTSTYYVRCVR